MPLLIVPYTLGAELPAAPVVAGGGAAYYGRRKRFLAYLLTCFVLVVIG